MCMLFAPWHQTTGRTLWTLLSFISNVKSFESLTENLKNIKSMNWELIRDRPWFFIKAVHFGMKILLITVRFTKEEGLFADFLEQVDFDLKKATLFGDRVNFILLIYFVNKKFLWDIGNILKKKWNCYLVQHHLLWVI